MRRAARPRTGRVAALGIAAGFGLLPAFGVSASAALIETGTDDRAAGRATSQASAIVSEVTDAAVDESVEVVARNQTTVSGVGGSTARIQLPVDSVIDLRPGGSGKSFAGADLEGAGPALGFVLSDNVPSEDGGQVVYGWQLSDESAGVVRTIGFGSFEEVEDDRFLIPAGAYSLYLVGDGSPMTVTFEFDALVGTGATTAAATRAVPLDFQVLDNRAPSGDTQDNLYSVGQKARFLEGPGFHAIAIATKTPSETETGASGFCYYTGSVSNEDTAYMPGCPNEVTDGADADERTIRHPANGGVVIQAFRGVSVDSGLYAMGYWRWSTKVFEEMSAIGYTLAYDPEFTPQEQ